MTSYLLVNLFGSLFLSDVYIPSMLDPGHYGKLYTILNNPCGTAMIGCKNLRFLIVSNIQTDIQVIWCLVTRSPNTELPQILVSKVSSSLLLLHWISVVYLTPSCRYRASIMSRTSTCLRPLSIAVILTHLIYKTSAQISRATCSDDFAWVSVPFTSSYD